MRNRFLNIDYFNSDTIEILGDFLHLPLHEIPPLPPSHLSNFGEDDLRRCIHEDDVYVRRISPQLDTLPIDKALSKFLSDVLPNPINVGQRCFLEYCSDEKAEVLQQEVELESQKNLGYEAIDFAVPKEKIGVTDDSNSGNVFDILQFEMRELDPSLENVCNAEEAMHMFSEVSYAETSEEVLNPIVRMQDMCKIQETVFAVENISVEHNMDQSISLPEDAYPIKVQSDPYYCEFPLFEVDVSSLGIVTSTFVENEVLPFESIEPQNLLEGDGKMVDGKELLQFVEFDILEHLSCHSLKNQYLEADFEQDIHLFRIVDGSLVREKLENCQGRPDDSYISSTDPILFEEFQYFNLNSSQSFDLFSEIETIKEEETCQQMFCDSSRFRNFNELIVIHELTLIDDSFKSLPVPILSHYEKIRSIPKYFEETAAELKPQPSFASDAIYLDWHILEEDACNSSKYPSCLMALEDLDVCPIDSNMNLSDGRMLVLDLVFSDNLPNVLSTKENKGSMNIPSDNISMAHVHLNETSSRVLNDGWKSTVKGEPSCNINSDKVSSLVKSMSQFNDLDYFLNPLKSAARGNHCATEAEDNSITVTGGSSSDSIAACDTGINLEQWDIKSHEIRLSDDILALIDELSKNYLTILENETTLRKRTYTYRAADDLTLLSLSTQKLMDFIKETSSGKTSLVHHDDQMMAFITLYAIKRMAWYLCYYGIHTTYLYINKLHQSFQCLESRISSLRTLMLDALDKVNKEITISHPSLSVIHEILQSKFRERVKILIVAERVFWWPLKRLLTSMGISCSDGHIFLAQTSNIDVNNFKCTDTIMNAMLQSDCCLVSLKYISTSFPFDKFRVILEYGGSYGLPRLSTISAKVVGFPALHFLKVDLEYSTMAKALCENVDMPKYGEVVRDGDPQRGPILRNLDELLDFMPVDKYNLGSLEASESFQPCSAPLPIPCVQLDKESTRMGKSMSYFPDAIIVVNTLSADNEMIISRRSTYQRILAMEKEGKQIVERDLDLPVDVIVTAALCLVWYDYRNIGKKATASNEASSSLPLCVENIAANVLTSLSFTFSGCILVFEGESSFLAGVMESSDELYAAAASLGVDLQLFFSYSSEMTDEIILSCILHATKYTRGLYPRMPESETLAESFFTSFPSVNPISAHAILSSVGTLIEFFEWSHANRVCAVQKYHIPDESIALVSAVCRYGEREDCKSGTTDCSSVSSAPDSDKCLIKNVSEMRKRKYNDVPLNMDMPMDKLFHLDTSIPFMEGRETPARMSKQKDSCLSKGPAMFDGKFTVSFEDKLFPVKQASNTNMKATPSRLSRPCDLRKSGHSTSEELYNHLLPANDALFCQNQGLDADIMIKSDTNINSGNLLNDFMGEVIDINDTFPSIEHSPVRNSLGFLHMDDEMERDPVIGFSKTVRKLSFGSSSFPTFPAAAEINYEPSDLISTRTNRQKLGEQIFQDSDQGLNNDGMFSEHQKDFLKEDILLKTTKGSYKHSTVENDISHYGSTPLSKAINFTQPYHGSPWTIEFLNRIREKSRLRQKSLPSDLSAPSCLGHSGDIPKATKRKSPSILDFYKYQRGNTPYKRMERKRQKHSLQPPGSSKNEKTLPSFLPAATPIDKRARETLTFATSGSGGQSKLVWCDKNNQTRKRQF